MKASDFALVLTGVLLNAAAQLSLKAGTNALGKLEMPTLKAAVGMALTVGLQPYVMLGLLCYVLSVGIWIVALSRVDVSVAYPMLSIGYVVNAFAAWALLGETLTATRLVGIGVILVGVVILSRSV